MLQILLERLEEIRKTNPSKFQDEKAKMIATLEASGQHQLASLLRWAYL